MKRVFVEGVGNVTYPDDWSDEDIRAHLAKYVPAWLPAQAQSDEAPPSDPKPAAKTAGFLANLKGGFLQAAGPGNLQTYSSALASAADALGYSDTRNMLLDYAQSQGAAAEKIPVDPVRFSELLQQPSVLSSFRNWLGRSIGSAGGSTLGPLAGAAGGAAIGGGLGGLPGAGIGALIGGGLAAQQMGAGDVYQEIAQTGTPAGQGLRAQVWGVPYGLAEMALGPEAAAIGKYVLPTILKSSNLSGATKQGLVRTALKSAGQEAVANPLQEMMVMEGAREARGDPFESLMEAPNGWRLLDAAAEGAVGGAALGGAVGLLPNRPQPQPSAPGTEPKLPTTSNPQELPPLVQDNTNLNPYGAVNENMPLDFGPGGETTRVTGNPAQQLVTPPAQPEPDAPFTGEGYNFQLPKGGVKSRIVPAEANLAAARALATGALEKAKLNKSKRNKQPQPTSEETPEIAGTSSEQGPPRPPTATPVPNQSSSPEGPRYQVKPLGAKGEETYAVVDTTKKPRSKGWIVQSKIPSPVLAQQTADAINASAEARKAATSPAQSATPYTATAAQPTEGQAAPVEEAKPNLPNPSVTPSSPQAGAAPPEVRPTTSSVEGTAKSSTLPAQSGTQTSNKVSELSQIGNMAGGMRDGAIDFKKKEEDRSAPSPTTPSQETEPEAKVLKEQGQESLPNPSVNPQTDVSETPTPADQTPVAEGPAKTEQDKSSDAPKRYASLNEMQGMEFGRNPEQPLPNRIVGNKDTVELLTSKDGKVAGWAIRHNNEKGEMEDWSRMTPAEAENMGLWPITKSAGMNNHTHTVSKEAPLPFDVKEMRDDTEQPRLGRLDIPGKEGGTNDTNREIYRSLRKRLDEVGLTDVSLRVQDRIFNTVTGAPEAKTGGRYFPNTAENLGVPKFIEIARRDGFTDVRGALHHEMVHALKDLGLFTETEWDHLEAMAEKDWLKRYNIEARYGNERTDKHDALTETKKLEEAIAEAGREYFNKKFDGKSIDKLSQRIFEKIRRFFEALANWKEGLGFKTFEDVFDAVVERSKKAKVEPPTTVDEKTVDRFRRNFAKYNNIAEAVLPPPSQGYLTPQEITSQANALGKHVSKYVDEISNATEMILGNPNKIGKIRQGVYSGWVNKFREIIQTTRGLAAANPFAASLYGKTGLRYSTAKALLDSFVGALHEGALGKTATKPIQDKAMAALEIWNWKGERPDITGPVAVKNDLGHDLDYSKRGDEIVLRTPEELAALKAIMKGNDLILEQMRHAVLKNLGLDDTNITPAEAKAKYEELKTAAEGKSRKERKADPELERWRKITKELVDFDKLMKQAYLPRIRFGNAGVAVYKPGEDGKRELVHFQTIEGLDTKLKAYLRSGKVDQVIKDLRGKYKESDGYEVSREAFPVTYNTIAEMIRNRAQNTNNPYYALLDNIPTILTMLNQQQLDKLQEGDIREVQQYLAKRLSSGTVAQHMLEAKKILGSDTEVPRVLGQYGLSMSNGIAKMQTAPLEQEAFANILATNDVKLIKWADDYLNYLNNPNEEWNRMKSLGFTWNLGFNPASAALNFANIATMYGPYVSQWATGVAPVTRSMGTATKTAASIMKHTFGTIFKNGKPSLDNLPNPELLVALDEGLVKKGVIPRDLYDYLVALNKDGVLDHGLSLEQLGAAPEYGSDLPEHWVGKKWQAGVRSAATFFRWTEAMARLTSAVSLYELMQNPKFMENFKKSEKDKYVWQAESGGDPTEGKAGDYSPHNVAKYILKDTFGDYDKANRPAFMKGFWGVVNQFSQYPVMMMETMFQHLKPFTNLNDAKTVAKMLGVAFLLSGMSGFAPGSDDLKRIFENLYRVFTGGKKIDLEKEMLDLMVEKAGVDPGLARDIMYGPYRAIPGIENVPLVGSADIGKRVALNTVPAIDTMLNIFAGNAQVSPVVGPAGIMSKLSDTWDAYHRGTPYALTNLLPTAFHNVSQGFMEWADTGVRNRYNNVVIDPAADGPLALTANDYSAKMFGFTPQKVTTARLMDRFERDITESTKGAKEKYRSNLMVAMQQQIIAQKRGDEDRYQTSLQRIKDIMKEIIEHDKGMPVADQIGIRPKDFAAIRKEAIDSLGTALKTEKRTPKAKRPEVHTMRDRLFPDLKP